MRLKIKYISITAIINKSDKDHFPYSTREITDTYKCYWIKHVDMYLQKLYGSNMAYTDVDIEIQLKDLHYDIRILLKIMT